MTTPLIHVEQETLVRAPLDAVRRRTAALALWQRIWPRATHVMADDRGPKGIRWIVSGDVAGTAEVWLQPVPAGVVVHVYLRVDPPQGRRRRAGAVRRTHARYARAARLVMFAVKDELERASSSLLATGSASPAQQGRSRDDGTGAMADQTTSSITVAASPAAVMNVIADIEAYPEWTGGVQSAEILTEYEDDGRPAEVRFVLDAGPIKDSYTLSYRWAGDEVHWSLVEAGLLKAMDGSYVLVPNDDGSTEVTYNLSVDVSMPMLGLMKRRAEKVIIDTALRGLKQRVEG